MIQIVKILNQVLAFSLELVMLGCIALWGFRQSSIPWQKYGLAVGLTLIAVLLWGVWAAPKSEHKLPFPARYIFELAMFFTAAFLAHQTGHTRFALIFGGLAFLSVLPAFIFDQA